MKTQHLLLVRDERQLGAALPQDLAAEQGGDRSERRRTRPPEIARALGFRGPWVVLWVE